MCLYFYVYYLSDSHGPKLSKLNQFTAGLTTRIAVDIQLSAMTSDPIRHYF